MEPPRKKARIDKTRNNNKSTLQWNPAEFTFLMGTDRIVGANSSIRRAFGSPLLHPLSERQLIREVLKFQRYPEELRCFHAPEGYDANEEGQKLPQIQDDGRVLILFKKDLNFDDYTPDPEDWNFDEIGYRTTEVFYTPDLDEYEVFKVDMSFCKMFTQFSGDGFGENYKTLTEVLNKLKLNKSIV